ncbi:hypothetical protein ABKN59_006860 [Abortiporus biennis]
MTLSCTRLPVLTVPSSVSTGTMGRLLESFRLKICGQIGPYLPYYGDITSLYDKGASNDSNTSILNSSWILSEARNCS